MTHEEREQTLSKEDYIELRHRFGTVVESVVRDKQAQAEKPNDIPWYLKIFDMEQIKRGLQAQADEKKVFKMRDATPEEQEAIDRYIKSISKPTGVDFWDLADGEYISRKALLEDLYKRDYTKFTHRDFVALVQYQDIVAIPSAEPKTDVLDKIRNEIKGLTYYWCEVNPKSVIDDALQIIDKYKAESELSRDIKEIEEVINCDADAETKCNMISNIVYSKPHYFKTLEQEPKWIPVSERLPEDTYPVNITWVNHNPEPYYATIKDKPFTATGCYCDGKWYWYSVTCQDYLDEYRYCDVDSMDEAIEVIAWMPLPTPYKLPERSE